MRSKACARVQWAAQHWSGSGGQHSTGAAAVGSIALERQRWAAQHWSGSGGQHSTGAATVCPSLTSGLSRMRASGARQGSAAAGAHLECGEDDKERSVRVVVIFDG